jgi:integrase
MIEHSVSAFHSGLSLPIRASSKARKHRTWVLPSWGARLELSHRRLLWMTSTRVVKEMLGHANIRQTMDTYFHVLPNMQQAADRMDQMLG